MLAKNIKDTNKIAKIFLHKLLKSKKKRPGALVVGLSGELGAGKTAFTKLVAKHLGIKNKVSSPTYVIMKKYVIHSSKSKTPKFFFHLDAYRLKTEKELLSLGWAEMIKDQEHLIFIEWPENVWKAMPQGARFVYIKSDKNSYRNFKLQ